MFFLRTSKKNISTNLESQGFVCLVFIWNVSLIFHVNYFDQIHSWGRRGLKPSGFLALLRKLNVVISKIRFLDIWHLNKSCQPKAAFWYSTFLKLLFRKQPLCSCRDNPAKVIKLWEFQRNKEIINSILFCYSVNWDPPYLIVTTFMPEPHSDRAFLDPFRPDGASEAIYPPPW